MIEDAWGEEGRWKPYFADITFDDRFTVELIDLGEFATANYSVVGNCLKKGGLVRGNTYV